MPPAIRISNLSKSYLIAHGQPRHQYSTLRESLSAAVTWPLRKVQGKADGNVEEFWALKDVTVDIQEGEVVGVIGRNGAGKSTLLKVLSRITAPTSGRIELRGRVGSLLEVGTGFHPELTGRENIFLNGSILGMRRCEVQRLFDDIVEFSGVEKFLDTPVKRYSSGMYVRLAFAVAAHLDPEILFVDEVLAVGDIAFQRKCLGRMAEVSRSGRTILFVSHNMAAIKSLTKACAFMENGKMSFFGDTTAAIDRYLASAVQGVTENEEVDLDYFRRRRVPDAPVRFRRLWVTGPGDARIPRLASGEDVEINCEFECLKRYDSAVISFCLANQLGERVATMFSADCDATLSLRPGRQTISCTVCGLPLSPGKYNLTVGINETANTVAFDMLVDYPAFEVFLPEMDSGSLDWPHRPWGAIHWTQHKWITNR